MNRSGRTTVLLVVLAAFFLGIVAVPPSAWAGGKPVIVYPIDSKPFGKTYSEWSDAWWRWAFGVPVPVNPLFDETGENADQGQSGNVYFLAGVFNESGTAERVITVPPGKALFFPILNVIWDNLCPPLDPQPPPDQLIPTMQGFVTEFLDAVDDLHCELDGVEVPNPFAYRVGPGGGYSMTLPDNNIYQLFGCADATPGTHSPFVSGGYYLMLTPLSAGTHTLHFSGHTTFMGGDFTLDITYHIQVGAFGGGGPLLARVMPNPLNPTAVLSFTTSKPGPVEIRLFDPSGRLVRRLFASPHLEAGRHEVAIDGFDQGGRRLPSGILFYRIRAGDDTATGQFVILK